MTIRNTLSTALTLCAMVAALALLAAGMGNHPDAGRQQEQKVQPQP